MTASLRTPSRDKKHSRQYMVPLPFFCPHCRRVSELKPSQAEKKHRCPFCGEISRASLPRCPYRETAMQDKPTICEICREMTPYGMIYHLQKLCQINSRRSSELAD